MKVAAHIIRTPELLRIARALRDSKSSLGAGQVTAAENRVDDALMLVKSILGGQR